MSNLARQHQPVFKTPATSCQGCRHFSITHNAARPYGCKAFGLMSRQHPARDIMNNSGEACRMRSMSTYAPFALQGDLS